jgi:3'-5' exonuclease
MTNLLYIDIETCASQSPTALADARELVKVPANYKKPEVIEKYKDDHADEAYRQTALKGISGEIISIAWAIDDKPVEGLIRKPGEAEARLLQDFFNAVMDALPDRPYPRVKWVGHNILGFDLPFLMQRCWINNVKPTLYLPIDARHDSDVTYDTMRGWAGWKGFVSQEALCKAFGIQGKDGMTGADVHDEYLAGHYDKILAYNVSDVEIVRQLHRRLTWAS